MLSSFQSLEVDFHTGVNLYTIVLRLHGTVFGTLIITERLVQQIGSVCIERCFYLLSECVAGIQVNVAYFVIEAVEGCYLSHFVEET